MDFSVSTWIAQKTYWAGGIVGYPLLKSVLAYRKRHGKEDAERISERFGWASAARPSGPLVWVHAASVGETLAVSQLMDTIKDYGISVLLTTGTVTSASIAEERFGGKVTHQYVPLDIAPAINRFLDHWKPDLAINVETEVWPVTIAELKRRKIAQVIVNGRISDRSFDRWLNRKDLARSLFSRFACVMAQTDLDAERFGDLGAYNVNVTGNLKVDRDPPAADAGAVRRLQDQIGTRPVWAAISTFEGEEAIAADVHVALKRRFDRLLTIIVPRHPERGEAILSALTEAGLKVARQSAGDAVTPETDVLLGDTIGDMGLYLRLTGITFVGRSLTARGGQNPFEPAMLGAAIITGPHIENFRDIFRQLRQRGAVRTVDSKDALQNSVELLLRDTKAREAMVDAGHLAVREMRGALGRTMKGLERYLSPLVLEARFAAKPKAAPKSGTGVTVMHERSINHRASKAM